MGREAGFDLVRIAKAVPLAEEGRRYLSWIEDGRHAEMTWITPERANRSSEPNSVVPGARSVICVGLAYGGFGRPSSTGTGKIARYAWGRDYHAVLGEKLGTLSALLAGTFGGEHRWFVDTGPLMDKALAARAGIGWYGKHTNIISSGYGSYILLGEIVTTLILKPDAPQAGDCGACRLCQVACPTGALAPDYSIDSRKCISFLTIEHRGAIPLELRPMMGSWVFGCDICQDVCPPAVKPYLHSTEQRTRWASGVRAQLAGHEVDPPGPSTATRADPTWLGSDVRASVDLVWLLRLSHAEYVRTFRGTSIKRAKVWMLRRNAAVALGNVGEADVLPSLTQSLQDDEEPLVRGHVAWAIGRIGRRTGESVTTFLASARESETDEGVREELRVALESLEQEATARSQ